MSKSKSTKQFPYDELHDFVKNERKYRLWWIIGCLVLAPLISTAISLNIMYIIVLSLIILLLLLIGVFISLLIYENTFALDTNYQYMRRILEEIHAKPDQFTEAEIANVERRAEIGKNAGATRTLLFLLLVPIFISLVVNVAVSGRIDTALVLSVWLLFTFAIPLLLEVERANTNEIILHAISEYQKQRKYAEVVERKTETDEMRLHAIVEAKKKHPHIQANEKRTSAEVSRLIRTHGIPANQPPSQWSVASTNGVRVNDEATQRSNSKQ